MSPYTYPIQWSFWSHSSVSSLLQAKLKSWLTSASASAFYGFTPILIPQEQPPEALSGILKTSNADVLVTAAGSVPLQELLEQHPGLKQVIWVVERTSRHLDWNEVPEGVGGKAEIAVWHDNIEERKSSVSADLPTDDAEKPPPNLIFISQGKNYELVEFTHEVGSPSLLRVSR